MPAMKLACLPLLLALTTSVGAAPLPLGAVLPPVALDSLHGPARSLAAFRGKPLLINVWASWCGPCRAEMGSLDRLARRLNGRVQVIGISTDDDRAAALAFLRGARLGFPNYLDHALQLETLLGADRIPLTLLVDARGRVLARHYGSRQWDSAQNAALVAQTLQLSP